MQSRRPAPLSEQLFAGPMLLGSRCVSSQLPVKNTFVDLPSGFTPSSTKCNLRPRLLTAPASLPSESWLFASPVGAEAFLADSARADSETSVRLKHGTAGAPVIPESIEDAVGEDEEDDETDDDGSEGESSVPQSGAVPAKAAPPGALHPSIGSEGHAAGACKKCCFFARNRCANGYDCTFCHYEHERKKRKSKRNKKTKRILSAAQSPPIAAAGSSLVRPGLDRSIVQPCMVPVQALAASACPAAWPQPVTTGAVLLQGCYLAPQVHVNHAMHTVPYATSLAYAQQPIASALMHPGMLVPTTRHLHFVTLH